MAIQTVKSLRKLSAGTQTNTQMAPEWDVILVTGGAGFIGSNLVRHILATSSARVVTLDKLTYAGNLESLAPVLTNGNHEFIHGDIGDSSLVSEIFARHQPSAVINLAAETHVDRSIHYPGDFIATNVVSTQQFLVEACKYWSSLPLARRDRFRFVHVSTDEVFGSLAPSAPPSSEDSRFAPNSPYAASKAASDHLVRAFHHTYGLPTLTTNCTNNYGPYQFPEKLIPLMICCAIKDSPMPVYGDGCNIRDWLYVEDHCRALVEILQRGRIGDTYNIGGDCEVRNIDVVEELCDRLDVVHPRACGESYRLLISFVADRPGHDRRYAIDTTKVLTELGWRPRVSFSEGLTQTVRWYLENQGWIRSIETQAYRSWMDVNYQARTK